MEIQRSLRTWELEEDEVSFEEAREQARQILSLAIHLEGQLLRRCLEREQAHQWKQSLRAKKRTQASQTVF